MKRKIQGILPKFRNNFFLRNHVKLDPTKVVASISLPHVIENETHEPQFYFLMSLQSRPISLSNFLVHITLIKYGNSLFHTWGTHISHPTFTHMLGTLVVASSYLLLSPPRCKKKIKKKKNLSFFKLSMLVVPTKLKK